MGELREFARIRFGSLIKCESAIGSGDLVHVLGRNSDVIQQCLARLQRVSVGIIVGDVTLVPPPEVHERPVDLADLRMCGNSAENSGARRPPGEGDVGDSAVLRACTYAHQESIGDALSNGRRG